MRRDEIKGERQENERRESNKQSIERKGRVERLRKW